ncbi:Uncharacterized protein OBRU01_23860 [Operophtera brumata]|uniref:Uncharacterized protein n=1 Tax=Operophtera brumata TaxID=104452 RepID=A0A0L7KN11_OPEBR|nr:Uncharacterized protein OBRU01_23860 [Operophtera brumata]
MSILIYSENEEVIKYSSTIERVMYCVTKPSKRNRVETNNVYLTRTSQSYNAAKTTRKNREPYHNKHNSITVLSNLKNDRDDILKMVVDKILARYDIANSSSVYVIVADSDVNDTNLTDAASSTLSLRLPENFFDYSTESNNYQPLRKFFNKRSVAQGLKIETKRKKYYTKGTSMTFEDQKILDQHNDDEPTSFERQFRCFSMDTTEDKPCCCCCSQKEQDNTDYESKGTCMPNVFSELLTPMIVSQGFAQGSGNCFKPPTHTMEAPMPQCAVGTQHPMDLDHFHNGLENIPPECNTPSIRILREMQRKQDEGSRNVTPCTHLLGEMQRNKGECSRNVTPCTHLPEEMQRKQTEFSRNVQFNGRGYVKCQATENNSTVPIRLGDNPCISSGQPTMKDKCINSYEKQKNVGLHDSRPCPGFKPTTVSAATEPICSPLISTGTCTCEAEISEGLNKKPCICKCKDSKTKKKKEKQNKIICECPVVIEKEVYIEPIIYNDEKEDMKMRSELTQTVSGFKFDFKKRLPLEEEISFEDALIFIEQNPCAFHGTNDCCTCDGKLQPQQQADCECNPAPNCECPNDPLLPQEMLVEEPLKGLKIHIGGKGSGSKGLAGICCFDMLQESNGILLLHD